MKLNNDIKLRFEQYVAAQAHYVTSRSVLINKYKNKMGINSKTVIQIRSKRRNLVIRQHFS